MSVIKSLVIAFSMYSKIPMPHLELEEKDMRYVMGFFPLAGLVMVQSYMAGCISAVC